jgi:hypothetical protein
VPFCSGTPAAKQLSALAASQILPPSSAKELLNVEVVFEVRWVGFAGGGGCRLWSRFEG